MQDALLDESERSLEQFEFVHRMKNIQKKKYRHREGEKSCIARFPGGMASLNAHRTVARLLPVLFLLLCVSCRNSLTVDQHQDPILIGYVAPFKGPTAASSESTRRGLVLAIDEINKTGGVFGRPLRLILRHLDEDPEARAESVNELVKRGVIAVFGGVHDDVIVDYLGQLQAAKIPLIHVWGSLPKIMKDDRAPIAAFCMTATASQMTEYLTRYVVENLGAHRPVALVETGTWGNAHVDLLARQLAELQVSALHVERIRPGVTNMQAHMSSLRAHDPDVVILIANPQEGAVIARTIRANGWNVPIVAHSNVHSNHFWERAGPTASHGVSVVHTKAFLMEHTDRQANFIERYHRYFQISQSANVYGLTDAARGYDGVYLLVGALHQAGRVDKDLLLYALENSAILYEGVLKDYHYPFANGVRHALALDDHAMAHWQQGSLVPTEKPLLD